MGHSIKSAILHDTIYRNYPLHPAHRNPHCNQSQNKILLFEKKESFVFIQNKLLFYQFFMLYIYKKKTKKNCINPKNFFYCAPSNIEKNLKEDLHTCSGKWGNFMLKIYNWPLKPSPPTPALVRLRLKKIPPVLTMHRL